MRFTFPKTFFTYTDKFFRSDWPNLELAWARGETEDKVLEIVLLYAFIKWVPDLTNHGQWVALAHQAGGYTCEYHRMIATRLTPRPEIYEQLRNIARKRFMACGGRFSIGDMTASGISDYVMDLREIGVDCDWSYRCLTESMYPIDATHENVDKVSLEVQRLSDLIERHKPSSHTNAVLLAITENSD